MPSDIPTARKLLDEALVAMDERTRLSLIRRARELMTRDSPIRRASVQKRMDSDIAKSIRLMARTNPDMHQTDIAAALDVNPGRVSEALNDKETKH
tara:strand:+ start:1610 stop:1897 length:288 start_codon:yes stop_codon:yes gene_type:complete